MIRTWRLAGAFLTAAVAAAYFAPSATSHPRLTRVTWSADIRPILERRCAGCHYEGGFSPMALTRYEQARDWSRAIAEHAMERRMPPWPAAPGIGDFANDRSLTPTEVELLQAWAEGGAAEGTPRGPALAPPRSPAGASALVLDVPASGTAIGRAIRYDLPLELPVERRLVGWEFQPRDRPRVERAVLGVATEGRVASWTPPELAVFFPEGVSRRLRPGSALTIEVYYRKASAPVLEGGRVALYFGSASSHDLRHQSLPCGATVVEQAMDVLAIEPEADEAGAVIEALAQRPDRSVEPLILVPRFLPGYAPAYRLRSAVRLPRGTRVDVRSTASRCGLAIDYIPAR